MISGPVTGGFLKGKSSRFQVFGDTVTTGSLISLHGVSGSVHLSEATADLLVKAGKHRWVVERQEKIDTAEKGELQTYWLVKGGLKTGADQHDLDSSINPGTSLGDGEYETDSDSDGGDQLVCQQRWIEWNLEIFRGLLRQILARRAVALRSNSSELFDASEDSDVVPTMPLEEVKEIIELPKFDKKAARRQRENLDMEVPVDIVQELRQYITEVADLYNHVSVNEEFAVMSCFSSCVPAL